ncbi:hypothetical protein KP806_19745 [Paenibacillus sp. N4]|uniref:hypothetical protein n=1 Tax=Paenibacillus vietnamensis TaxID=2590547 RepID=UPI001CD18A21|nr:hypothetical protein [Paenibacillus vietnamensis]MCA0757297.1 hypothetical protein [Paenibacillus vietnamensis]
MHNRLRMGTIAQLTIDAAGQTIGDVSLLMAKDSLFYSRNGLLANAPHFYEKLIGGFLLENAITLGSDYSK